MLKRPLTLALIAACALRRRAAARAGHELPFYPGYYPQEIRIETLAPAAAVPLLAQERAPRLRRRRSLRRRGRLPAHIDRGRVARRLPGRHASTRRRRARRPRRALRGRRADRRGLGGPRAGYVAHPYPVTPYHADYLQHADWSIASRRVASRRRAGGLRVARPRSGRGEAAHRRTPAGSRGRGGRPPGPAGRARARRWTAGFGPPWLKEGWFHA